MNDLNVNKKSRQPVGEADKLLSSSMAAPSAGHRPGFVVEGDIRGRMNISHVKLNIGYNSTKLKIYQRFEIGIFYCQNIFGMLLFFPVYYEYCRASSHFIWYMKIFQKLYNDLFGWN
ncbi:MAG: hypothetical protein HQM08_19915 [Candidatus Riflebacteria bacterium]|nr:hypothetical protein [Candidatus Riflebacteria bacterium]